MEGKTSNSSFSSIRENLHRYIETRFLYYKVIVFEKTARATTAIVSIVVAALFVLLALLFFSAALGFWLGTLLESDELGMLIVGGFYLLLGIILYSLRTKIFSPGIIKTLGKSFFEEEEEDEDE